MRETAAYTGTRRRAQRQAAEAGGWWAWATSRWMAFPDGRGEVEQVLHREVLRQQKVNDGGR